MPKRNYTHIKELLPAIHAMVADSMVFSSAEGVLFTVWRRIRGFGA